MNDPEAFMVASRNHSLVWWLGVMVACAIGCDDPAAPPAPGSIIVVVSASGPDVVRFGYRASVDNGPARALDSLTPQGTFTQLEPRAHSVRLEGLAPNCTVTGQNPISVTVVSNQAVVAPFTVACVAHVGSVRVATVTTGELDPDGYTLYVDGVEHSEIGVNAAVTIPNVSVGPHTFLLGGVASNCTLGTHQITANVVFNATVDVTFSIQCVATGSVEATVATSGAGTDPNGYAVWVQSANAGVSQGVNIPANGTVTISRLRPAADYHVTLVGLSANCRFVSAAMVTVTVTSGVTTPVAFEVSCEAPRLLALVRDAEVYVLSSDGTGAVRLTTDAQATGPAWSSTGTIAFTSIRHDGDSEIYVVGDNGANERRLTTSTGTDDAPAWSPDGGKIVFHSTRDGNSDLYVMNADGSGVTRLTTTSTAELEPAWSSTGRIAFISDRDEPTGEIYVMNADGSNVVRLTRNTVAESNPTWSPDGSLVAFAREAECYYGGYGCGRDIFVVNANGSTEWRLATGWSDYYDHGDPSWSPDGRSIAFTQQYCDYYYGCVTPSVWLTDLDGARLLVITDNGAEPAWKP